MLCKEQGVTVAVPCAVYDLFVVDQVLVLPLQPLLHLMIAYYYYYYYYYCYHYYCYH